MHSQAAALPYPTRFACHRPAGMGAAVLALLIAQLAASPEAHGGIGPENVVVVVNADSHDSRTIANHYVHLRDIPSPNVVLLDDVPAGNRISLDAFRDLILKPLLTTLEQRQLSAQVRVIAYSAGFPTAVDVSAHRQRLTDPNLRNIATPVASINGLTFFYRQILSDQPEYLRMDANLYARGPFERYFVPPFAASDTEHADRFQQAKRAGDRDDDAAAAEGYAQLFRDRPDQHPLAVMAAAHYQAAGKPSDAVELLSRALQAGWTSRRYLADHDDLGTVLAADSLDPAAVARLDDAPILHQPAVGFAADRFWTPTGVPSQSPSEGIPYLLSMVLAVTEGQGTSVDEAVAYLSRAANADRTHPDGCFYFSQTDDVRSTTRKWGFAPAAQYLQWLDRRFQIIRTPLPQGQVDCMGLVLGSPHFDWSASGSQLLPGALADNLTSAGGVLDAPGQTKLVELLRAGAAASSGTVTEPFAIQAKFPLPMMQAYYAEGASAAEAFYLSVQSPYQLLIVGDPLCQPFARPPVVEIDANDSAPVAPRDGALLRLTQADATGDAGQPSGPPVRQLEFYVDGRLAQRSDFHSQVRMGMRSLAGGVFQLRVVAIGDHRLEPRVGHDFQFQIDSLYPVPTARIDRQASSGDKLVIQLTAAAADRIRLLHFADTIAQVEGPAGQVQLDRSQLGDGPLRLQLESEYRGAVVRGAPFTIGIDGAP